MNRFKKLFFLSSVATLAPVTAALFALTMLGCGDHGGDEGDGLIRLTGSAFFPTQVVAQKTPVASTPFSVVDFQRSAANQVVFNGNTGSNGEFDVTIVQSKIVAIIVAGPVRVSGLISADGDEINKAFDFGKDFDGITDVACEAGATAIATGAVSPDDFSAERIRNLELGSQVVQATTTVNFQDPASVTAAAAIVRNITDDGDHPPA